MYKKKSKKITFIIDSLGNGGAENVCVTLANKLVNRGWDIKLCLLKSVKNSLIHKLDKKIQIETLNIKSLRTGWIKILSYLRNDKPKKIMCFFYQTAILLIILRMFRMIKTTLIIRNVSTLSRKHAMFKDAYHKHFLRLLAKCTYSKANHIIAQSEGMKSDLIKNYKVPKEKIKVIYNPFKSSIEDETITDIPPQVDVLCVGRLVKVKGYEDAIKAISILKTQGKIVTLRIIGNGPEKENLIQLAHTLNVFNQINFYGEVEDIKKFYMSTKLTLLTSRYEGFPNILVESIFCRTPIVAYDCESGPREIITEQNGILVPEKNIDLLSEAIDIALHKEWDKKAIFESAQKYKSDEIINQYEKILMSNY
jgi:glycosyltransferase involved in cell wall biosynthesis